MDKRGILVIGAGPTGLGAAWRLNELGYKDWTLIESSSAAGGLSASVIDDYGFTWDLGGHVLFSHYAYFDRLMETLLGDQWVKHQREAWVWIRDRWIPYPFQVNIWRLPPEDLLPCLDSLLTMNRQPSLSSPPADFRQWLLQSFGQGLCDVFMFPYNRKVWAYDPSKMDVGWMGERVATVDLRRVIHNLVHQRDEMSWGPNSTFAFPLHGGTGRIWETLARRLPQENLLFGRSVVAVDPLAKTVRLDDGRLIAYEKLISTMPLDLLISRLAGQDDLIAEASRFVYSSSHIIGIGMQGQPPEHLRTKCWMYFPEDTSPFYRVTVFSNYSPNNVARPGEQWSLMAEVSESSDKPVDVSRVVSDTLEGCRRCRLISSGATILSTWHRRLEHGYPTPWLNRDEVIHPIQSRLQGWSIYSRGRFGGWKYEVSNQDHSLMQGVEVVDHLLRGDEEITYWKPSLANAPKPRC